MHRCIRSAAKRSADLINLPESSQSQQLSPLALRGNLTHFNVDDLSKMQRVAHCICFTHPF